MISLVSINFFLIISQSIIASARKKEREKESWLISHNKQIIPVIGTTILLFIAINIVQRRAKRKPKKKKKKWIDTHVNVNPGNIEDLGRRLLARCVTVELVPAAVPLEGVKGRLLEIVMAAENHLLTTFRYLRNYF